MRDVRMDKALERTASIVRHIPYSPDWPIAFRNVESRLRVAFKPIHVRLDHIGSTSVPGLLSKDVIDVQLGVQSLDGDLSIALQDAGFGLREGIWQDHVPPGGSRDSAE